MRRSVVIGATLVFIAFIVVGSTAIVAPPTTDDIAPEQTTVPELVYPGEGTTGFWPYLNARTDFEKRSPINVIVVGASADDVIQTMKERTAIEWNETDHDDIAPGEVVSEGLNETFTDWNESDDNSSNDSESNSASETTIWGQAAGTTRYAYVAAGPDDGAGTWVRETYQLDYGDYYGSRYHIRLYESPGANDDWVVMQAHTEHFDWFTLRHAVDGVEEAQSFIEADYMDQPFVDTVWRKYLNNRGPSDSDGWATVIELSIIVPPTLIGFSVPVFVRNRMTETDHRRLNAVQARITIRHLILAGSIVLLYLGVRATGIVLERHVSVLSMHAIAALLYPIIAIGIPVATYTIATGLERRIDAAMTAGVALSVGILLDYSLLGVDVLPLTIVLHRAGIIIALGLIAGGATVRGSTETRWNDMLIVGGTLWTVLLASTLVGLI